MGDVGGCGGGRRRRRGCPPARPGPDSTKTRWSARVRASRGSCVTRTVDAAVGRAAGGEGGAHLRPQLGVQGGQRLVEQQHPRVGGQRPGERHPLGLAVGQLRRAVGRRGPGPRGRRARRRPGRPRRPGAAAAARPERDVGPGGEVREEQVVGGEHADPAATGRGGCRRRPPLAVDPDVPGPRGDEPGQACSAVVLPAPFGPSTATTSPSAAASGRSRSRAPRETRSVGVEAHRSHRPRSTPRTTTATTSIARLRATAVCGSSWRAT